MIFLEDVAQFLNYFLAVHRFPDEEKGGIYQPSSHPIHRFGLALEPGEGLTKWAKSSQLSALFLHRPWKLQPHQLSADVGVVAYHLAFDEQLTLGFNPRLASVFAMSAVEVLGEKQGRPIGMIGEVPTQSFLSCCTDLKDVFGGYDKAYSGVSHEVHRVAVVGAMTDALIREAAARGAEIYITGQLRQPAEAAVIETGISVVAVGHRRCEQWGLRALAGVLRERWYQLEVFVHEG